MWIRSDVVIYRLQIRELSHFLMELLGGEIEFETESIGSPHHRLGRLSRRFKSTRVHLCTRKDQTSLLDRCDDVLRPTKPLLLFVPTLAGTDADIDSLDEHHRRRRVRPRQARSSSQADQSSSTAMRWTTCAIVSGSVTISTKLLPQKRQWLRHLFRRKRFPLTDAVGLWYLAEFLSKSWRHA